jgi:hypothetical protein
MRTEARWCLALTLVTLLTGSSGKCAEFPPGATVEDIPQLLLATSFVREMSEPELVALVPLQPGLRYVDCPNCTAGRQENQLVWKPDLGEQVVCQYCDHRYPSSTYPMNDQLLVTSPQGKGVAFPYWQDASGYRHFFLARRDDEIKAYLANRARELALLYAVSGEEQYARRAALILNRFAEVFPDWIYHYDYPFRQKEFYDGQVSPSKFRSGFRTARWTWWAYSDIPVPLVEAYDWIRDSHALRELSQEKGLDIAARIETDFFFSAADQVLANTDDLTNMSPVAWRGLVITGRILNRPEYIHEVVRRIRHMVETKFFYDGVWYEGAPSYGAATVEKLDEVLMVLQGYSDPIDYLDPVDGSRFQDLDVVSGLPALQSAHAALMKMRLPNGRLVPVHDTWPEKRSSTPTASTSAYLLPALGHACLGGGPGRQQTQFHLTWSGGYGHSHADNLSLLAFAFERELLSDLGYTHTAYRSWTLATAAHNTVVVDGQNQTFGSISAPSDGQLRFFDASHPWVQVVSADGGRGYQGLADVYRRTLIAIKVTPDRWYTVDWFQVAGGTTHDYFLHGDADGDCRLTTDIPLQPVASLLPEGYAWTPTTNEGEAYHVTKPYYAYGFLSQLSMAELPTATATRINFAGTSAESPGSTTGLGVWLLPESNSQLIVGRNPSIRRAAEDDARLLDFHRPFAALRHQATEGKSAFVTVIEPFEKQPVIESVRKHQLANGALAVEVKTSQRTDCIVLNAQSPVALPITAPAATYQGEIGVLMLEGAQPHTSYALGAGGWQYGASPIAPLVRHSSSLISSDAQTLVVRKQGTSPPSPGSVVRLVTEDNWVYPFTVSSVSDQGQAWHIQVVEPLLLKYDTTPAKLMLLSYPQREHTGRIRCQWES